VGHGFTGESLIAAQDERLEDALWTAMRALEEAASLRRRMAERVNERGLEVIAEGYERRAKEAESRADLIRDVLEIGHLRAAPISNSEGAAASPPTERSTVDANPPRLLSDPMKGGRSGLAKRGPVRKKHFPDRHSRARGRSR